MKTSARPRALTVLLLRHGQTDSNAAGILQGHQPTSLNTIGRLQADRLALRLQTLLPAVDALVSSDLVRALETAAPIARALGVPIEEDPAWRERAFGDLEGQALGALQIWRAASGAIDPPGGEPSVAFRQRILDALHGVVRRHADRRCVAVVTHGGAIRGVLQLMANGGLPLAPGHAAPVVEPIINGSILHLSVERRAAPVAWRALRINDADHLQDLATGDMDPG